MKRVICVISAALLLSGCGGASVPPDLDKAITMTADISYGKLNAAAQLSRIADGSWEAVMLSPYPLEGMKITLDGETATAELNGAVAQLDVGGSLSAITAVTNALEAAIDGAKTGEATCVCTDSKIIVSGNGFSVTVSGGVPVCLEAGMVSAEFGEVTVSDFCDVADAVLEE